MPPFKLSFLYIVLQYYNKSTLQNKKDQNFSAEKILVFLVIFKKNYFLFAKRLLSIFLESVKSLL